MFLLLFEGLMLLCAGLCLRDALRGGPHKVALLAAGIGFGLLLEWATLQQLDAYTYGDFSLMIAQQVPLSVGVGWGVILYSSMKTTDAMGLPTYMRPAFDALLALNIDVAMDAIAIRLGMWDWAIDLQADWFGVPWENYWAWFWVVFFFSSGARLTRRIPGWVGRWLAPIGALALGLVGVVGTNHLITQWVPGAIVPAVSMLPIALALSAAIWLRPRLQYEPGIAAVSVPLVFHAYFLVSGLVTGILLDLPVLLVSTALMLAIALWIQRRPDAKDAPSAPPSAPA
ncbi:MAG: hypothetical protein ACI9MC_003819 [Kiritimatiellia bacterium]|jgi:hypothetical protein